MPALLLVSAHDAAFRRSSRSGPTVEYWDIMNRLAIVVPLGLLLAVSCVIGPAQAQIGDFFRRLPDILGGTTTGELTDTKIAAGLRQALEVATGNAVGLTGRLDGYFANQAIKIL